MRARVREGVVVSILLASWAGCGGSTELDTEAGTVHPGVPPSSDASTGAVGGSSGNGGIVGAGGIGGVGGEGGVAGTAGVANAGGVAASDASTGGIGGGIGDAGFDAGNWCLPAPPLPPLPPGKCTPGSHSLDGGPCAPDCSLPCPAHGWCDDTTGAPKCVCAPGYVLNGASCTWQGVVADPSFAGTPVGSWALTGGPSIQGKLVFPWACMPTSSASQILNVPEVADGEAYALRAKLANDSDDWLDSHLFDFSIGDRFEIKRHMGTGSVFEQCLGERSYGQAVPLQFRPRTSTDFCNSFDDFIWSLDDVELEPSDTCPTVGRVLNGDFETSGGWTSDAAPDFTIGEGLGNCGSRGARLWTTSVCDSPQFRGELSIPTSSIPNAAVRFSAIGTPGTRLVTWLGPWDEAGSVDTHVLDGMPHEYKVCAPEWAKGVATEIHLGPDMSGGSGSCADPALHDVRVDDFSIVSDPTCPAVARIIDGGFEALGRGWGFSPSNAPSSIGIYASAGEARSGTHSLRITVDAVCGDRDAWTSITVPEPTANAGPAVSFYYRFQKSTSANTIFWIYGFEVGSELVILPESTGYEKFVYCLDPSRKNHHSSFHVLGSVDGGGVCGSPVAPQTLHVDDITVGTDPSCPVQ